MLNHHQRGASGPELKERFRVRQASPEETEVLLGYLERDPLTNLFVMVQLRDRFQEGRRAGLQVWMASTGSRLIEGGLLGVCLVLNRLAMPVTPYRQVARAFSDALMRRGMMLSHIVGECGPVGWMWEVVGRHSAARLNRPQRYYTLSSAAGLSQAPEVPVYKAHLGNLEAVAVASSAMHLEETFTDPMASSPDVFRLIVRRRILEGRAYVWMDDNREVIFKTDVSCVGPEGVLLSGVYTRPDCRRRGVARRALVGLCRQLLERYPAVLLYVNEGNTPAIRLYETMGFRYHRPYRTIFIEEG